MARENGNRGAVTLRDLNEQGNYFAQLFPKWDRIALEASACPNGEAIPADDQARVIWLANLLGRNALSAPETEEQYEKDFELSTQFLHSFSSKIAAVRADINQYIDEFIPPDLQEKLRPIVWKPELDNKTLYLLCNVAAKDVDTRIRFESLRSLQLAVQYSFLDSQSQASKKQFADEKTTVQKLMNSLNLGTGIEEKRLAVYLDERDSWKCRHVKILQNDAPIHAQKKKNKIIVPVYYITVNNYFRRRIEAIVQARRKSNLRTFAKSFTDPQLDLVNQARDWVGARLAYFNLEDMQNGMRIFDLHTIISHGKIRKIPSANKHADKTLRLSSQRIILNGEATELQHIHLMDLLDIVYSTTPKNHGLYHFRCDSDVGHLLDQLFPEAIYEIDWRSEEVRRLCEKHIISQTVARNRSLLV